MAYLSWSFLKMGEKAERSTSFLFLLMAGVPVLFAAFFAFVAGMTAILYAGPVLALMLLPFYLPCALREEKTRNACSRNILFGRKNAVRLCSFPRPAWAMFPPGKRNGNAGSTA